ncbi:MAG: PocR ligand-binding domain-containing protein [Lentisphaeria bacterium]|nr:PocR ligand-binding domain-containing protein [Lentisphaeria bacterium]MBR7130875.1 PocR ligand-binding domain-containing protein [Lentisphaeria bacterium]
MSNMPMELFLSDEVQRLLDDFASLLDVRVTFYSLAGESVRRGKEMRNCSYCSLVHEKLGGYSRCVSMDCDKQQEAVKKLEIINYRCHAGLHECLAPVRVKGRIAGFVMFGQFRIEGESEPVWDDIPEKVRAELHQAYQELPCFTHEKLQAVLGVLKTLIDYISVRELAVLQGDRLRHEIDQYIEKHAAEDIRLPDMAKKLGRSVSTISQFLRNNYQTSFKGLLLDARLKIAEKMWHDDPGATVAEVAFASGFCDQFYFSRVFSRRRGMPPGKFRSQMRRAGEIKSLPDN